MGDLPSLTAGGTRSPLVRVSRIFGKPPRTVRLRGPIGDSISPSCGRAVWERPLAGSFAQTRRTGHGSKPVRVCSRRGVRLPALAPYRSSIGVCHWQRLGLCGLASGQHRVRLASSRASRTSSAARGRDGRDLPPLRVPLAPNGSKGGLVRRVEPPREVPVPRRGVLRRAEDPFAVGPWTFPDSHSTTTNRRRVGPWGYAGGMALYSRFR